MSKLVWKHRNTESRNEGEVEWKKKPPCNYFKVHIYVCVSKSMMVVYYSKITNIL